MRTNHQTTAPPRATHPWPAPVVKKSRLAWMLWLIPVGAVAICAWFFYRDYVSSGPLITIYFDNAEGLESQGTQLNYRGAQVGVIKSVDLSRDTQKVKVTARLAGSARALARAGSVFWIVRPEVRIGAITGLRTIISGDYVTVQPGAGPFTNVFQGADKAPLSEEPHALQIVFLTSELGSLQDHTPIFYRGVQVGQVDFYQLTPDARQVSIHARITPPYAPLVRVNSKFWNAGGIDFHFGLFKGAQISAESPKTVISGGIAFATPPDFQAPATNGAVFVINEKPDEKWKTWAPIIDLHLPAEADGSNTLTPSILK
jgi:paraquat-inducible protein B